MGGGVTDQISPIPDTIRSIDKAKLLFTFNAKFAYNSLGIFSKYNIVQGMAKLV